jgi:hypothetical protein
MIARTVQQSLHKYTGSWQLVNLNITHGPAKVRLDAKTNYIRGRDATEWKLTYNLTAWQPARQPTLANHTQQRRRKQHDDVNGILARP